jgi:hypothetical protein
MNGNTPKYVFLGYRRGGSSIGYQLLHTLYAGSCSLHDVVAEQHQRSVQVQDIGADEIRQAFERYDIVGVFRDVPPALQHDYPWDIRPVVVVRDPRDCVLSWFYARKLHLGGQLPPAPGPAQSLSEYLRAEDSFLGYATRLLDFGLQRNGLILRYEDMIRNPVNAIRKLSRFIHWPLDRRAVDRALLQAQFQHVVADSSQHQRIGEPFAALNTLPAHELSMLNTKYARILEALVYPISPAKVDAAAAHDADLRQEIDAMKRFAWQLSVENSYRINEIIELRTRIAALERAAAAGGAAGDSRPVRTIDPELQPD